MRKTGTHRDRDCCCDRRRIRVWAGRRKIAGCAPCSLQTIFKYLGVKEVFINKKACLPKSGCFCREGQSCSPCPVRPLRTARQRTQRRRSYNRDVNIVREAYPLHLLGLVWSVGTSQRLMTPYFPKRLLRSSGITLKSKLRM